MRYLLIQTHKKNDYFTDIILLLCVQEHVPNRKTRGAVDFPTAPATTDYSRSLRHATKQGKKPLLQ